MQYALLIYETPGAYGPLSDAEVAAVRAEYMDLLEVPGVFGSGRLRPAETATTVRVQDGKALFTDGPFADTKEVFGGYYLLEADDLDAALALAKRVPAARLGGSVEVRALM